MRDFDPEKRRGRWTLYFLALALVLVAGHFVTAGYEAITRPASPHREAVTLHPRLDALPVRAATYSPRIEDFMRIEEAIAAGPAAAAAATPPAPEAASWVAHAAGAADQIAGEAPSLLRANRPQINLRSGPGLQYGVRVRVGQDVVLTPTGRRDGDWIEVTSSQHADQRGWVSRSVTEERR